MATIATKRKRKEVRPCDVTVYTEFRANGVFYVAARNLLVYESDQLNYASLWFVPTGAWSTQRRFGTACEAIKQMARTCMEEANGYDGHQA